MNVYFYWLPSWAIDCECDILSLDSFFYFKKNHCPTLGFFPLSWVRIQTYSLHTHEIQIQNNNLWISQRVVLCENWRIEPATHCMAANHSAIAPNMQSDMSKAIRIEPSKRSLYNINNLMKKNQMFSKTINYMTKFQLCLKIKHILVEIRFEINF